MIIWRNRTAELKDAPSITYWDDSYDIVKKIIQSILKGKTNLFWELKKSSFHLFYFSNVKSTVFPQLCWIPTDTNNSSCGEGMQQGTLLAETTVPTSCGN